MEREQKNETDSEPSVPVNCKEKSFCLIQQRRSSGETSTPGSMHLHEMIACGARD